VDTAGGDGVEDGAGEVDGVDMEVAGVDTEVDGDGKASLFRHSSSAPVRPSLQSEPV